MRKILLFTGLMFIACGVALMLDGTSIAGNGNPKPGYPKDTIVIHIQKEHDDTFSPNCEGGHSLHIGATQDADGFWHPEAVTIEITMKDWVLIDNDNDGQFDEDPLDGVDQDGDGLDGEDPIEPNFETFATDCDSRAPGDNTVAIQIGDKDPDKGEITAQSWFIRLNGPPQQPLYLRTSGKHTVECTLVENPDGIIGTADDVIACSDYTVDLGDLNITEYSNDIAYKKGGKNAKGGGKTSFVDITELFLVDYDDDNDGFIDEDPVDGLDNDGDGLVDEDGPNGAHIFSTTCYATFGISTDEDPLENPLDDQDGDGLDGEDPLDGLDNDGDGLIDEDPLDGLDNDNDGLNGEDPADGVYAGIDDDGDETGENCPLGSALWDVDPSTGNPLIKLFVIHDEANVPITQTKKIKGHNK
jgi:hypothetical protein